MAKFNSRSEILRMIQKYVAGKANADEIKFLETYYEHFEKEHDILESMSAEEKQTFEAELHHLVQHPSTINTGKVAKLFTIQRIAAAAVLVIICATSLYFYTVKTEKPALKAVVQPKPAEDDIAPGRNTAILTLSDGTKVNLDSAGNGRIASQAGLNITKRGSQLIYSSGKAGSSPDDMVYNVIETPRGGEYMVMLPDGTKVWLNAASKLKYPAAFAGNERTVELQGEAYFEVASNKKMPFRVKTNLQSVEVLGTHFNINSYSDESSIRTTLLEGSVKVSLGNQRAARFLKAGEQSSVRSGVSSIGVTAVNVEEIVAWKNGYFLFNNEDIESVMRKISRWYNVDIDYKGKIPEGGFGGAVSKSKNISEVLRILELTKAVHFKVQGRRVTVMS